MKRLVAHHFHKDHILRTALFSIFTAAVILLLDVSLAQTVSAPTLPALVLPPSQPTTPSPVNSILHPYIEVVDSCGPYYQGTCVNMRSGPGEEYPVVMKLRTGIVLKVDKSIADQEGRSWYKLIPDTEKLRFPERITSDWYVSADVVQLLYDDGDHILSQDAPATNKRIVVSRSKQMLYAYEGDTLFMEQSISTGLELTPTPLGTYKVYKMTPSRYMQGPIEGVSDQYYDLPGVPWNLYFTKEGAVIHGAYWHNHFGEPWSHGCVNVPLDKAKELYLWADIGTLVTVQE